MNLQAIEVDVYFVAQTSFECFVQHEQGKYLPETPSYPETYSYCMLKGTVAVFHSSIVSSAYRQFIPEDLKK